MNITTVSLDEPTSVTAAPPQHPRPGVADRLRLAATYAEKASVPMRAAGAGVVNLTTTHDPALCAGRSCSRHHPSNHHMRAWPKVWREYYGFHDRMCSHGVGHPDPDDVVHLQSVGGVSAAHPCDGCCIAPLEVLP